MAATPLFVPSTKARRRLSPFQAVVLAAGAAAALGAGIYAPVQLIRFVLVVHLVYGLGFTALRLLTLMAALREDQPAVEARKVPIGHLPSFTLLCPLYREAASLPNLLGSLDRLSYPRDRLEALLLVEEDDDETLASPPSLPDFVRVVRVPPGGIKTKPNALNEGLARSGGDIVGIYDAEDRPEADQLRKVAAAFVHGPDDLACVQGRLNYYNRDDGFITRMFALEYAFHFDLFLPGMARFGLPLPLGGTSNFIRRDALLEAGGWDPYNVTEDADLGIRLARRGFRMKTVDSTTFEEATDTPARWIRQRSRWIKGFIQTTLVHLRRPAGPRTALTLHLGILAVVISALLNPLTWCLFALWALGAGGMAEAVFAGGLGSVCLVLFICGNLGQVWLFMAAPLGRGWFTLSGSAFWLPFYWLLQSVAGYKALLGFVFRPHYWEKTEHTPGENTALEAA